MAMNRRTVFLLILIAAIIGALGLAGVFNKHQPAPTPPKVETPTITIAIDPGHGGHDPGGVVGNVLEKDVNLAIAEKLATLIDKHSGLKSFLTRSSDVTVKNLDRLKSAEEAGAILYLSVHTNSYSDPHVHGTEVLVDDTRPKNDPSWLLAESVQKALVVATGTRDRGVKSQSLYLEHTRLPAVSVEVGFLTAADEGAKLLDPTYQDKIAHGLLNGIVTYLKETGALSNSDNE